jgi:hypothetical protein
LRRFAWLLLLGGCDSCADPPRATVDAGPSVDAAPPPPDLPTGWAWERAAAGDPIARLRLGEELGAAELLALARGDQAKAEVALAALADAPDAPRLLAEIARAAHRHATRRDGLLRACLKIAERRPTETEVTAPREDAAKALRAIADDAALPSPSRNLALSALRALQRASGAEPW